MKVKELMELLKSADPNADVLISSRPAQRKYAIEYSIYDAAERKNVDGSEGGSSSDILLMEGIWLRDHAARTWG